MQYVVMVLVQESSHFTTQRILSGQIFHLTLDASRREISIFVDNRGFQRVGLKSGRLIIQIYKMDYQPESVKALP